MKYKVLGSSDIEVSRICLGTWQAHGWESSDDARIEEVIHTAIDSGVNFIDTAPAYGNGHSERLVGKAISGKRDKVVLATKVSHNRCSPEKLRKSLEESLSHLQTDYIDLLQQHWPGKTPPLQETLLELEKLKEEGKIRAIGVSNWEEREWEEINDPSSIDSFQPCYSLLWRRIEESILPLCKENNIGVIAYSPLCQGLLTGRFRTKVSLPKDPRKNNVLTKDNIFPKVIEFLDTMQEIADKNNRTLADIALQWVLQQEGITSAIVGCSKKEQLEAACISVESELPAEDLQSLSEAGKIFIELTRSFDSLWNWHPRR